MRMKIPSRYSSLSARVLIEMDVKMLFLLAYLSVQIPGEILLGNDDKGSKSVSNFIGSLIRDESNKDSNTIRDVAVITSKSGVKSQVFNEIVEELSKTNVLIIPNIDKTLENKNSRVLRWIVIITDISKYVSFYTLNQFLTSTQIDFIRRIFLLNNFSALSIPRISTETVK